MDWLTYRTDVPFEKVIEACIVRGLFELSKDPQTLTDQTIQEWCDHTWTVVGELLSEVP